MKLRIPSWLVVILGVILLTLVAYFIADVFNIPRSKVSPR